MQIAGWWVWVVCLSFGLSRDVTSDSIQMPMLHSGESGKGINMQRKHLPDSVMPLSGDRLTDWFKDISTRLSDTEMFCLDLSKRTEKVIALYTDWYNFNSKTITGTTNPNWVTGWYLDPPYNTKGRGKSYLHDNMTIANDVREWAIEQGQNQQYRIAVSGYKDDYKEWPSNWDCVSWQRDSTRYGSTKLAEYSREEVIYFSPYCLKGQGRLL